jgi:small-conductance mechanosensitive channel
VEVEQTVVDQNASQDIDVDSLMQGIEAPSQGIPMSEPAPATPQPSPEPQKYTMTVNGREITATLDQLQKWAQQGYDYPQKMQALKTQQAEFEQKYKPYQEIDEYARQNPDWWTQVQKNWEQRAQTQGPQPTDPNNPLMQELNSLRQEFMGIKQIADQYQNNEKQKQRAFEDQQLTTEIQSMRELYKHLDWNSVDDRGYPLETQVMAYANERGIKKFDDAFKAYNLDRLMSIATERGKEQVGRDIQKRTKLGLLATSPTPSQKSKYEYDKSKSYEQLEREALEELGLRSS